MSCSNGATGAATDVAAGAILAGGAASRFGGRAKGLERVGGARIIDRLAAMLTDTLGTAPLVVSNDPGAARWAAGLSVVPDDLPGEGALGGIYTAVRQAPAPVICVAWDMPFVTRDVVRLLADALAGGADAVLPASPGPRGVEPLCAGYGPACEAAIRAAIARGDRRGIAFHHDIRLRIIPLADISAIGDPARLFFNINTAEDLEQAELQWAHP